jgi:hypothetical protein
VGVSDDLTPAERKQELLMRRYLRKKAREKAGLPPRHNGRRPELRVRVGLPGRSLTQEEIRALGADGITRHQWTPEQAKEAGRLGGLKRAANRRKALEG